MGRIGQAVARRARAFGLQIHYHNRRRWPRSSRGTGRDLLGKLDQMLARMDIIPVNCPTRRRRFTFVRTPAEADPQGPYVTHRAREVIDEEP